MRTSASAHSSQKTVHPLSVNDSRYAEVHARPVFPTSNRYNSGSVEGFQDAGLAYTRTPNRKYKIPECRGKSHARPPANEVCFCIDIRMANVFKSVPFCPVVIQSISETLHTCGVKCIQSLPEPERNLTQMIVNCGTARRVSRTPDTFLNQLPKRMFTPRKQSRCRIRAMLGKVFQVSIHRFGVFRLLIASQRVRSLWRATVHRGSSSCRDARDHHPFDPES